MRRNNALSLCLEPLYPRAWLPRAFFDALPSAQACLFCLKVGPPRAHLLNKPPRTHMPWVHHIELTTITSGPPTTASCLSSHISTHHLTVAASPIRAITHLPRGSCIVKEKGKREILEYKDYNEGNENKKGLLQV